MQIMTWAQFGVFIIVFLLITLPMEIWDILEYRKLKKRVKDLENDRN